MQANRNKPKTTLGRHTTKTTLPQPDLRFVRKNSKPDTQRGKSPNNKTHKKDLPRDTADLPLCHTQKHAKINYPPRHSLKLRNRSTVHSFVDSRVSSATRRRQRAPTTKKQCCLELFGCCCRLKFQDDGRTLVATCLGSPSIPSPRWRNKSQTPCECD